MLKGNSFVHSGLLLLFLLFLGSASSVFSQNYSDHIWYFGNSTEGIIFNKSDGQPQQVNSQNPNFGIGGGAVATDPVTMKLLFYTDGNVVYDATHQAMPGSPLGSVNNINQAAALSPFPGQEDRYLILTNNANFNTPGTIRYHVVDMTQPGNSATQDPLGTVTDVGLGTGINNSSEAMLTTSSPQNPKRYWLIVPVHNTASVNVYEIANGPAFNLVSTATLPNPVIAANISYSETAGKIALAPQNQNRNIQILDFNAIDGTLSYDQAILNSANTDFNGQAIYDTEWSDNGQYLYISRHGGGGQIGQVYQYDFNNQTTTLAEILNNPVFRSYGLQIAPDNRIYHLYQNSSGGPFLVGRINFPDSAANLTNYQVAPLSTDNFNAQQFPSFLPAMELSDLDLDFTYIDSCQNNTTKFFPSVADDAEPLPDRYRWFFGDGSPPSDEIAPSHEYQNPGVYNVGLIAFRGGEADTVVKPVQIIQNDNEVDLGMDTVICIDEVLELDAGAGGSSYVWSTGETGQTISVDTAGYYWVAVTYPNGCEVYDGIQVDEYGAQVSTANFWYFGNQAGIDFNQQPPEAVTDGQMTAPEGTATISDRNGDLLFYTDGVTVWGRDHSVIGEQIGGENNSTQSSIIIPFPGDETLFYIFTTEQVDGDFTYNLNYSIVDIKENGGIGKVIVKNKPLFSQSTERMTAINGQAASVLLAHELGNNTFRAYPIDSTGINNPVLTSIGSPHNFVPPENGEGYMKFSPDGSKVAVSLSGPDNAVELFDFIDSTLTLTNYLRIELDEPFPEYQVYGIEFSSGGDKLFVSLINQSSGDSKLYEFRVDSAVRNDVDRIKASQTELYSGPESLGAIQIGPDGQIYVARNGSNSLATISASEDTTQTSSFILDGFDLQGRTSTLGLPNFIQSNFSSQGGPTLTVSDAQCVGAEVQFSATPTSIIDEFQWTVRRASDNSIVHSAMDQETTYTFDTAGVYDVTLRVFNRCSLDTLLFETINVADNPNEPTIPFDAALCGPSLILNADSANTAGLSFDWTTGETSRTISVNDVGTYGVTITNPEGCTSERETVVSDGRPQFDLGPDQTVCQNDSLPPLRTGISELANFAWYINGTDQNREQSLISVNTANPGNFEYLVTVEDPVTGCVADDTVTFTVNPEPQVTLIPTPTACGNAQGVLEVSNPPTNFNYEWFDSSDLINGLGTGPTINNLEAGTYTLVVQDAVSGCTNEFLESIVNDPPAFAIDAPDVTGCEPMQMDVTLSQFASAPASISYILTDQNSQQFTGTPPADTIFTTVGVPAGSYVLEVTADGCVQTEDIEVIQNPTVSITSVAYDNVCLPNTSVRVQSNGNTYSWTGPGVFNTAQISPRVSGSYFLNISDNSSGLCPLDTIIDIEVFDQPDVLIVPQGDVCDGQLVLTAQTDPAGNYSYQWSTGEISRTITLSNPRIYNINLTATNQQSGCAADTSGTFELFPEIEVNISSEQACENGEPITLTADGNQPDLNFNWFNQTGSQLNSQSTDTLMVMNEGTYRVVAEKNGCIAEDEAEIIRFPITATGLEDAYVYCSEDTDPANQVVLLDPASGFVEYEWYEVGSDNILSFMPTFEVSGGDEGEYLARLTNSFGCVTEDTLSIDNDCTPRIFVPNAFSPNGDGNNELFEVFPVFVQDFEIFIFSRWGELIYYSNTIDFQWDGTFNGELLPIGTYPYLLRYRSLTDPERGVIEQRGGVALIR
ncbi:MAG: gliding motility-associated C-terminal domain-containing protein [Candidatus Cyclobacteriaceae bacterium M3_2C_046]